jgi:hypothetical protein
MGFIGVDDGRPGEIRMKLTDSQARALVKMTQKERCDYYDFSRSGANGKTLQWLVGKGYAVMVGGKDDKFWSITDEGRAMLRNVS